MILSVRNPGRLVHVDVRRLRAPADDELSGGVFNVHVVREPAFRVGMFGSIQLFGRR